ncbi:unnamed protein product [Adineta steineri]|uniref:Uncharacterized protein n=1 Tax=Adineta steineri TaxID=433720 RepID=A0A819N0I7_9BILA|nr:unnamed protein product [Adineta steineri]
MLPFGIWLTIVLGLQYSLIFIFCAILLKLPTKRFAQLFDSLFGFKIQNDADHIIIINICGDNFELSKKLTSRIPFALVLSMCLMVIVVVFIDGCILSMRFMYSNELCSENTPYCYLFKTRLSWYHSFHNLVCQPNESVVSSNISADHVLCYGFIVSNQTTIDIINQLGICSGILAIVETAYPLIYRFGHHPIGMICLVCLNCGILIAEVIFAIIQFQISYMTFILMNLMAFLITTIIYLQYKKRKMRKSRLLISTLHLNQF